jgi:hypothetical protein
VESLSQNHRYGENVDWNEQMLLIWSRLLVDFILLAKPFTV